MPKIARVQTDFVVDIVNEVQLEKEEQYAESSLFELVDEVKFVELFKHMYPQSKQCGFEIWDSFFGNPNVYFRYDLIKLDRVNRQVCYLTTDSCEKILAYYQLFLSGIDFKNLPTGFFLTKNPKTGIRDVLHYSDYLALHKPQKNPLAVILSPKDEHDVLLAEHFAPDAYQWYAFLLTRIRHPDGVYCTESELRNAFVCFSNTLRRLNLSFYQPDFSRLIDKNVNPIVLLARWNEVLTQPNLKKQDIQKQFEVLLQLDLTRGYGALRAINDYISTKSPCGFLLPEMFESDIFDNLAHDLNSRNLNSLVKFWRYIAFSPKRNSIDYYQKGLEKIKDLNLDLNSQQKMRQVLAESSTADAHLSNTIAQENQELVSWSFLCKTIEDLPKSNWKASLVVFLEPRMKSQLIKNYVEHLARINPSPNIPFLNSMAFCIEKCLRESKWDLLDDLSNQINSLVARYKSHFYAGAKFYLVDGQWLKLDVAAYVSLQLYLHEKTVMFNEAARALISNLSTFNLMDTQDIDEVLSEFNSIPNYPLIYGLGLFNDAITSLSKNDLKCVISALNGIDTDDLIVVVGVLEELYADKFPDGYFADKKIQLTDARLGLNIHQNKMVEALGLSREQTQLIIKIESSLVQHNQNLLATDLDELNSAFLRLSNFISEADLTFLLEKLESVRQNSLNDINALKQLIQLVTEQRSINDFMQIYYRNQIELCKDDSLIHKFIIFITKIKPLPKKIVGVSSSTIEEIYASFVLNSDLKQVATDDFIGKLGFFSEKLHFIFSMHPHLQEHLLEALTNIPDKFSNQYFNNVLELITCIAKLSEVLPAGESEQAQQNMLVIFSMLASFYKTPLRLVELWHAIDNGVNPEYKQTILILVLKLVENNQDISQLDLLIEKLKYRPQLFDELILHCCKPPYADISAIIGWMEENTLASSYQEFSMQPFGERRLDYAFDVGHFQIQKDLFKGIPPDFFTQKLACQLQQQLEENRLLTVMQLRQKFDLIKSNPEASKINLLCVCIEMLARTTSQFDDSMPAKRISQELNTTQVMALYAMLTLGRSKLISEIGTGEGKSRIKMILAACQVALGKTVDFMTSDLQLSERDFLTYNAFFTSLGIRSSLISLNTPKQLYQRLGVNFSDCSQLLLLRNQSDIMLDGFAFLDEDATRRCLLIDEVDKFMHDKSRDSYNYASPSHQLKGFVWIYPHLVCFVRQKMTDDPLIQFDAPNLINEFVSYVSLYDSDELHQASLSVLNEHKKVQLVTWLNSAYTALQMKEDIDYKLSLAQDEKLKRIHDVDGFTRYTREVLVLDSGRPVEGATFALGVHQCLCAIENQKAGKEQFIIRPENETQRSTFPVTFMSSYNQGVIFGASGTSRYEAPTTIPEINHEDYEYLVVPRHKKVLREDKYIWLAKDESQQIEFIKRILRQKLKEIPARPILLICKNDEQSQIIHEAMITDVELKQLMNQCTRVHGLTEKELEVKAIKEAGINANVTISTVGMFGRGVDINAANLFVASLYVPSFEDEKQIKGRTARAGKSGEYRMIPNMKDVDCPIDGNTYNIENEIDRIQKNIALQASRDEEVSKLYANFLEQVHTKFLETYSKTQPANQLNLLLLWQEKLSQIQKDWDLQRVKLLQDVEQGMMEQFVLGFEDFAIRWEEDFDISKINTVKLSLIKQQSFFKEARKPLRVSEAYDVSDDGQARIYSSLFVQEFAILSGERPLFADFYAWREGRGDLFPDFMATLRGERPLFANLRAFIARLIEVIIAWFTQDISSDFTFDDDFINRVIPTPVR